MTHSNARIAYREAIWAASDLTSAEKMVALAYEDHAARGLLGVWVTAERLTQRTGLSRATTHRALSALVEKGYMALVQQNHRRPNEYALLVPGMTAEDVQEPEGAVVVPLRRPGAEEVAEPDECEAHGFPGGRLANGAPRCPLCRRAARA